MTTQKWRYFVTNDYRIHFAIVTSRGEKPRVYVAETQRDLMTRRSTKLGEFATLREAVAYVNERLDKLNK